MSKEMYVVDGKNYIHRATKTNNVTGDKTYYLVPEKLYQEEPYAEITSKDCNAPVFGMLSSLAQNVADMQKQIAEIYAVGLHERLTLEDTPLNRRVESLADQVDTLFRNQVKQAELLESNAQDIRLLDGRTQVLHAVKNHYDAKRRIAND